MITAEQLSRLPLFAKLGPHELAYLARSAPHIHAATGEYLVHEGDVGHCGSPSTAGSGHEDGGRRRV